MSRDNLRLRDILESCDKVVQYASSFQTREEFAKSDLHRSAILHELTVIGEASAQITLELQTTYPNVPWRLMKDLRNYIVHQYFSVDVEQIWLTSTERVPEVRAAVADILQQEFGS